MKNVLLQMNCEGLKLPILAFGNNAIDNVN